ncbi:hypothetical protein CRENBAI_000313 [Crenichthys baileyi]|uniref:Uncharacterized protein n=1 Tax=Crenichthys baileyi TaxID=28760 RepID=A0AAV9SJQ3_9TELE
MDGSSLRKVFFWKKKKKSPLNKAFKQLKRALPKNRKIKKTSILKKLHLDSLKNKDKNSQKRISLIRDKKAPKSLKILSLGKEKKQSDPNTSEERKNDREGLGRVGNKIKKRFSQENKKDLSAEPEIAPLKETNEGKTSLQKLKDIMKPSRSSETKAT